MSGGSRIALDPAPSLASDETSPHPSSNTGQKFCGGGAARFHGLFGSLKGRGCWLPTPGDGDMTFASINSGIARLRDLGIVTQIGAKQRGRMFTAPQVIALFESAAVSDT
jgi:hypothetical protein